MLKHKAHILKYMACIFYNKPCVFFRGGKPQKNVPRKSFRKPMRG